jgi:hypothetical protein
MSDSNCSACRHFIDFNQMGQCRRYPTFVNRHKNEGCGEFNEKAVETTAIEVKPKRKYERKANAETSI